MATFDRQYIVNQLRTILTGWYRNLLASSESCAVWETPSGLKLQNFVSRSGKQCDGVTRMLPVLAAWVAQPENPDTITLDDGAVMRPLQVLRDALVHGTDPAHPDFWEYPPTDRNNQRQVESSIVAWSLWLARDQLLPTLSRRDIDNLQCWLEACTVFTDLFNNWSLFFATNHAARIALEKHGFRGDIDVVRKNLIIGDETDAGDGWMWDIRWSGLDYYNFWVNGSHHLYIRSMLPDYDNPVLDRALERAQKRFADLPYFIDAQGRNVLFGRSLAYRWGWLSGLMIAEYLGQSPVAPGLSRAMLARNIDAWLKTGPFNADGGFFERLSATGSDGGRDRYINCGHPYWGMQAFVCLALPSSHPFWASEPEPLPIDRGDFTEVRQGPGFVFQGIDSSGEVRLFNLRNLNHNGHALYEKFVYSSAFPCNAGPGHVTAWDNQLGLRLADGTHVGPTDVRFVDVRDGNSVEVVTQFTPTGFTATVRTTLTIDDEGYQSQHIIRAAGTIPAGAHWIEGGFTLPHSKSDVVTRQIDGKRGQATCAGRTVVTEALAGWERVEEMTGENIVAEQGVHFVTIAPVQAGTMTLHAEHEAQASGTA